MISFNGSLRNPLSVGKDRKEKQLADVSAALYWYNTLSSREYCTLSFLNPTVTLLVLYVLVEFHLTRRSKHLRNWNEIEELSVILHGNFHLLH